jgi:hypothetical protein
MATEQLTDDMDDVAEAIPLSEDTEHPISLLEDFGAVIFKLRAFMESSGGEYALGVETGMQRAADMIENVLKRHGQGE